MNIKSAYCYGLDFFTKRKKLFENFLSLSVDKIASYLIPLITFPYMVRVLGVENLGIVVFVQTIVVYFVNFISYGFNYTGTDQVAKHKENRENLIKVFNAVIYTKLLLLVSSIAILLVLIRVIPVLNDEYWLYIVSILHLVGMALNVDWLFIGLENTKYSTIFNLIGHSIFALLLFTLVKDKNAIILVVFIQSLRFFISGILSLLYAIKRYKLKFVSTPFYLVKDQIKMGFYVYLSNLGILLYTKGNFIILGLLTSSVIVGYFAIAEKIFWLLTCLAVPINRTIFPHLSRLYISSLEEYKKFNIRSQILIIFSFSILAIIAFFSSDFLVRLVGGESNELVQNVLKVLLIALPFSSFNGFYSQLLVIQERRRDILFITGTVLVINFSMVVFFIKNFGLIGLAINTCITLLAMAVIGRIVVSKSLKVATN